MLFISISTFFILFYFNSIFGGPIVKPCSNLRFSIGDVFMKIHFIELQVRGKESTKCEMLVEQTFVED